MQKAMGHSSIAFLISVCVAVSAKLVEDGAQDDLEVEQQRPVLDVVEVVLGALYNGSIAPQAVDPVSYTHLDVYKRQVPPSGLKSSAPASKAVSISWSSSSFSEGKILI